jgi:cysteine-rich repeat protein
LDPPALAGELVITEVMSDVEGLEADLEWFELYNPTGAPIDLDGLTIRDDDLDSFDITGSHVVGARSYFVVGASALAVPGSVDLVWDDFDTRFSLGNGGDEIVIEWRGAEIDRIAYNSGWPLAEGVSAGLSAPYLDAEANDVIDNWCAGVEPYGVDPNLGSPGGPNPDCSSAICGDGVLQAGEECDDGNTTPGDGCDADCGVEPSGCILDTDCTASPANYCSSPFEAVRFGSNGVCDAGECTYPPTPVSCDAGTRCLAGECILSEAIGPGELVISEYLADSTGSDDGLEWFEVYNASGRALDLDGLTVSDEGGDTILVEGTTLLPADSYFIFAESLAAVPGPAFDWTAAGSGFQLANTSDEIILSYGRTEIDRIEYVGSWPDSTGAAAQLAAGLLDADLNDSSSNWCTATTEYGTDDNLGTPGEPNLFCR